MSRFKQPSRPHDLDNFVSGPAPTPASSATPPAPKPQLSRLTVDIPADLHRQFKARCATTGTTMGDTITQLICEWIATDQRSKD